MLAPDSRALLLDALRPSPGHSLDHAVATTFTLDLESALTVPLAFAGLQFDEQPNPIEVMEAMRTMSRRLDVFCQAGAINAGRWPSDLLALLETVIHEVKRPRPGHIFHPKIWVLRFLDRSHEPSYRLLVLTRNLTADRSWDTILRLDGRTDEALLEINAPLSRFVAELPELTVTPLPSDRRVAILALADELRNVRWELPAGVREVRFHPIGLPGSPAFPIEEHFSGDCTLTISPFVRTSALRRISRKKTDRTSVLISRGEELSAIPPEVLTQLEVYELDPTAGLSADDVEEASSESFFTRLHAKLYVVERGRLAHMYSGSANATDAGLGLNVEFLCELIGPAATFGIDALVGEEAPLRTMLTRYVPSESQDFDEVSAAERALEDLLLDISAQVRFRTVVSRHDDEWVVCIAVDTALPHIPKDTRVTIAPFNRPSETCSLSSLELQNAELRPRALADITPFLQLTAHRTFEEHQLTRSTVVCSQLDGTPDDRIQEIMARQIDTPEKFLRLLVLLIGFALGSESDMPTNGDGLASWSAEAGQGILELLARALSESPEAIDHLETIVEHLRLSPSGREVLPPGWDDVWLPALEARRAMLEDAS